jgi:prepilin-type processing-associated H-X9-DG protein
MKNPWMPLYVGDYLAATQHLTTEQHGAYLLLIMHYWANGGLPTDPTQLMAIAKMQPSKWHSNQMAIASFFDGHWRHARIDQELAKTKSISEKRALAGLKGAWKRHGGPSENVWQMPTHTQSQRFKKD